MGAGDGHSGGDTVEAGLPNITGYINTRPVIGGTGVVWNMSHGALSSKVVYDEKDSSSSIGTASGSNP